MLSVRPTQHDGSFYLVINLSYYVCSVPHQDVTSTAGFAGDGLDSLTDDYGSICQTASLLDEDFPQGFVFLLVGFVVRL